MPEEDIPSVEDFDESKERLKLMGCTCDNIITGWEDAGETWFWYSQHEEECALWMTQQTPEND